MNWLPGQAPNQRQKDMEEALLRRQGGDKAATQVSGDMSGHDTAAGFTQSYGENTGWMRLPNGALIQWGRVHLASNAYVDVTFPVAFTSATSYGISTSMEELTTGAFWYTGYGDNYTATGCRFFASEGNTYWLRWMAIGF